MFFHFFVHKICYNFHDLFMFAFHFSCDLPSYMFFAFILCYNADNGKEMMIMETMCYDKKAVKEVAELLKNGKVVAFPTDTVFGLGVIYENEEALQALKESKGRPESKPIPTMVADVEQMKKIAVMSEDACALADAFMPGAFTLILKKQDTLPDYVTNGFLTVGIRMPDDPFVLSLIAECGKPLLVTSANRSGAKTGVSSDEVLEQLNGRIDAIVLGEAEGKLASTIVDMSSGEAVIVREGPIPASAIQAVLHKG